jgi:hypothetical protein
MGSLLLGAALALAGCSPKTERAVPSAKPNATARVPSVSPCADGGGQVTVPGFETWFPRSAGGYCIDANADQRVFGVGGALPIAEAEVLALDAKELDRSEAVTILVVPYVEDTAEPGRVTASVVTFANPDAAYAFYTRRIADAVELGRPVYATFSAGAAAVVGESTAFVVRAQTVLRLEFSNPRLPPARVPSAARPALVALGRDIGARLPGSDQLPSAARLLPDDQRVPLSLRYYANDFGGFEGVGAGAVASYLEGSKRYRLALAVRLDADAGKDVLSTLRKREGSRALKHEAYDALRATENADATGAVREWIFGRKGAVVAGVAFDVPPRAAPKGAPPERAAAVAKVKQLLDRLPAAPAW